MRELEEEVGRLKRELALANARPVVDYVGKLGMRTDAVSPSVVQGGVGKISIPVRAEGQPCIHGGWYGRCRVIGCGPKSEREIQAEARELAKAAVARAAR